MFDLIKGIQPILLTIAVGTFLLALAIGFFGVVLIYLGSTGETTFSFFGQTFESTNVGIGALFLAAALEVLVIIRMLKTVEHTTRRQAEVSQDESQERARRS